jgi:hypothetical protein
VNLEEQVAALDQRVKLLEDQYSTLIDLVQRATPMRRPPATVLANDDREKWDWTKPNHVLAQEHNVSQGTVALTRRALGKPKVWKWAATDVYGWDWTLPNAELARLNKLAIVNVLKLRVMHNAPDPNRLPKRSLSQRLLPVEPPIDWLNLDWNKPDVILSREVKRTREMVRQKRAQLGKPRKTCSDFEFEKFVKLMAGKTSVTSDDLKASNVSPQTARRYCDRAGIMFAPKPKYENRGHIPWHLMNWDIPNAILRKIWRLGAGSPQNHRSQHACTRAKWRGGSAPEQFKETVNLEKAKAKVWFKPKAGKAAAVTKPH